MGVNHDGLYLIFRFSYEVCYGLLFVNTTIIKIVNKHVHVATYVYFILLVAYMYTGLYIVMAHQVQVANL